MPLTPSDNPVFSDQLPRLDENSTAHADTWNQVHEPLLNNDVYLRNAIQAVNQELGGKVQGLDNRLHGVEASSAVSVQSAVNLSWLYGGNALRFELWSPGYTLIDMEPLKVIQGVNGDDSLDVESTASIRAGEYYVLTDPSALGTSALVLVQTVLSGTRIRLAQNMARDWGATAKLVRSSLNVIGARNASAVPGDIYLTRSINIGTDLAGGAVVIRRTLNAGLARLYYRDGYQPAWKECGWSLRRTGGDVPAGFADYEYILPMRGDGWLRVSIEGEGMTIAHIVALGQATGLGGFINPDLKPRTPTVYSPGNGAGSLMERPTLSISSYSSPAGNAQAALQIQLSLSSSFEVVMHDSGTLPAGLSYTIPAGVLSAGIQHWWRARTQDVAGLWSDWMNVATFSTATSFAYVAPATITGPGANATDVPEQPTITLSAFSTVGGADTHKSSQVQLRDADGSFVSPVWDSGADAVNKLNMVVPAGKLKAGKSYYLRGRQEGTNRGWGEYGPEVKITTKAQFANVIGIALVSTGGGGGQWARIDENGNGRVTDSSFFGSHAIYGAIQDVIIDGQSMVRIPAFYVKQGIVGSGTYAGKSAWWVSDQPLPGYYLHPAFRHYGADIPNFWVGKYQAGFDAGKLESKPGKMPYVQASIGAMRAYAASRNTAGVGGFMLFSIYHLSAIQLLAMIEMGGADSQALISNGHVSSSGLLAVNDSYVAAATWRGIVGLWGNAWQFVDGIRTDGARNYTIWDRNGYQTYQSTARNAPGTGHPVTVAADKGADYDLRDTFLPASIDSAYSNGTYGDYFWSGSNSVAIYGGFYSSGNYAGLFCLNVSYAENFASQMVTSRLSRV